MSCLRAVLFTLLGAGVAAATGADKSRDDEMVCVPAADGRSWECGTRANPPPERGLADVPRNSGPSAPPPPFLAAPRAVSAAPARPARPPPDTFAPLPERRAAPATATPPPTPPVQPAAVAVAEPGTPAAADAAPSGASAPATVEQPVPARVSAPPPLLAAPRQRLAPYAPSANAQPPPPPPAAVQQPVEINTLAESPPAAATALETAQPAAEAADASAAAESEPAPATVVADASEPAPADAPSAAPSEIAVQPEPAVVSAEPEPAAAQQSPAPSPAVSRAVAVLDSAAFLQLQPTRFTLQLARAASRDAALLLAQQPGWAALDAALFAVPVETAGGIQWLLLWSQFADAESARAAWQSAATAGSKPAAYPRRIGPLQAEVRRSNTSR